VLFKQFSVAGCRLSIVLLLIGGYLSWLLLLVYGVRMSVVGCCVLCQLSFTFSIVGGVGGGGGG